MEELVKATIPIVGVIGTGLIGRSWIQVFTRAGCNTRVYDRDPEQVQKALGWLAEDLQIQFEMGLITAHDAEARCALITKCSNLADALEGVGYVQESGPEPIQLKRDIYVELDKTNTPAIIGSSTSTQDITEISAGLRIACRCIIAHPVNPPHLIPLVEVLPGAKTDKEIVRQTCDFMASVGQKPVRMNFYIKGFLLNRMQAALLKEAITLVETGVADINSVDAVIRDGLGLRWALMGPFGVANTNADGGIREYFRLYGQSYKKCMDQLGPTPSFDPEMIERLGIGTDVMEGQIPNQQIVKWRDRLITKIRELKARDPHPSLVEAGK